MLQRPFVPMNLYTAGPHFPYFSPGNPSSREFGPIELPHNTVFPAQTIDSPITKIYSYDRNKYEPITDTTYCIDFNLHNNNNSASAIGVCHRASWVTYGVPYPYGTNYTILYKKGDYWYGEYWYFIQTSVVHEYSRYFGGIFMYQTYIPNIDYIRMYRINGNVYYYLSRDGYNWEYLTTSGLLFQPAMSHGGFYVDGVFYPGTPWLMNFDRGFYVNARSLTAVSFNSIEMISHG